MKLTNREKKLLTFLAILLFGFVYYQFVYTPQAERITQKSNELAVLNKKANILKEQVISDKALEEKYKVINSKDLLASARFFPFMMQEKIITILDDMINETGLKVSSISFSKPEIGEIQNERNIEEQPSTLLSETVGAYFGENSTIATSTEIYNTNTSEEKPKIEKMNATINFEGSYDQLTDFIKEIEDFDKKILIESISLAGEKERGEDVLGNMILNFYAIPKMQIEEEYFKWEYEAEYGKNNLFIPIDGYNPLKTTVNEITKKKNDYDFLMTVKPISSDLPTVFLGKSMDTQMKTYIYADNPNFEDVEFQIIQEKDHYYYKYKTSAESYPEDYQTKKAPFTPKGKQTTLNIITHKRNSDEDHSGVNLFLINQSDLKLNVQIKYDDPKKTRVNVMKKVGDISVRR
jgi:type IV pilus assembly protein PilO